MSGALLAMGVDAPDRGPGRECTWGAGLAKHRLPRTAHSGSPKRRRPCQPPAGEEPGEGEPRQPETGNDAQLSGNDAESSDGEAEPSPRPLTPALAPADSCPASPPATPVPVPARRQAPPPLALPAAFPAPMVSMATGNPTYVAPADAQRTAAEILVPVSRYDVIKVQGLMSEARRLALNRKRAHLRSLRRQLADAEGSETASVSPLEDRCDSDSSRGSYSMGPDSDCASDCASSAGSAAVADATRKVELCLEDIKDEMRWWRGLNCEVGQQLGAGVPAMQIICDFSVRKIFLR